MIQLGIDSGRDVVVPVDHRSRGVAGLPTSAEARRFALMIFVAFLPAVVAGAFFADFVQTVLVRERARLCVDLHPRRRRDARRRAHGARADGASGGADDGLACRWRSASARRSRSCPACRDREPRSSAACWRASTGRPRPSSRSSWRCRRWWRRSSTSCSRCRASSPGGRPLEIAIGFVTAFVAALIVVKPFLAVVDARRVRAVRLVSDRVRGPAPRRRRPPDGPETRCSGSDAASSPGSSSRSRCSSAS